MQIESLSKRGCSTTQRSALSRPHTAVQEQSEAAQAVPQLCTRCSGTTSFWLHALDIRTAQLCQTVDMASCSPAQRSTAHLAAIQVQIGLAILACPGGCNMVPLAISKACPRVPVTIAALIFHDIHHPAVSAQDLFLLAVMQHASPMQSWHVTGTFRDTLCSTIVGVPLPSPPRGEGN